MEVVIDNNITAMLDENYIYQVRQGMARIPEAVVHRWKNGERIKYETGCSIEPFSTFASGNNLFTCGSFSSIASSLRENSIVGRYVEIAPGCSMLGDRHPIESVSTNSAIFNFARENVYPYFHKYEAINGNVKKISVPTPQPQKKPLRIGNDVWIGNNCIISGGITINTGAVIASNSVVVKDVPPYAIVGGVPATIRKFRFPREVIDGLLEVKWWDYELGDMYREGLDFSNPEKFLSKFMSNVSNIRKYTPKPFFPCFEFSKCKKPHGTIVTWWGTILSVDESNRIMHEINSIYPIMGNANENYISLAVCRDGDEFYIDDKKINFLNSRVKLCVENNLDGTISIKCGERYLSARPNGRCALVNDNDKWEHFVVIA